jgi:hypothetical protein
MDAIDPIPQTKIGGREEGEEDLYFVPSNVNEEEEKKEMKERNNNNTTEAGSGWMCV